MELYKIYDNQEYKKCHIESLKKLQFDKDPENILYILKSIISQDSFKVFSHSQCKKLLFYYFYLLWKIEFENGYCLEINSYNYKISLKNISEKNINFEKFIDICNFWKNKHFLENIDKNQNIIDYILEFIKENSELYAFSWEHFPLFKWLINELVD